MGNNMYRASYVPDSSVYLLNVIWSERQMKVTVSSRVNASKVICSGKMDGVSTS